jgi:hypothetical protein
MSAPHPPRTPGPVDRPPPPGRPVSTGLRADPATRFVPLPVTAHPSRRWIGRLRRMVVIVAICLILLLIVTALHPDGVGATTWRAVHIGVASVAAVTVARWAIVEVLYARRRRQDRAQLQAWEQHRTRPPRR